MTVCATDTDCGAGGRCLRALGGGAAAAACAGGTANGQCYEGCMA